jgi:hypothetical protein
MLNGRVSGAGRPFTVVPALLENCIVPTREVEREVTFKVDCFQSIGGFKDPSFSGRGIGALVRGTDIAC